MSSNLQRKFRQDLMDLIENLSITYTDGTQETFKKDSNLFYARVPQAIVNNTNVVIIPKAPKFVTTVLGQNGRLQTKEKYVTMEILVFHDHVDEEQMTNNLEDLLWSICESIIEYTHPTTGKKLGDAMFVDVLDSDIMMADYQDAANQDLTSINFGWILVQGRFSRQQN